MPWYWSPFEEIERMRRRMERLMERLGEPFEEEAFRSFPVDISESNDELIIKADLPGFNKDEISVIATDTNVEIAAQHKEKKIEKTEKLFRAERRFGAVKRAFSLPVAVDPDTAIAEFVNGVLTLKIKKKEKKKVGKEIKIK